MNELMWLVMLLANFTFIMTAFRIWGKNGLLFWLPVSVIIANIQVTKNVSVLGLEATLGNIVYATGFLATDIIGEFYSEKDAAKGVLFGLFSIVAMTVLMQISLWFTPSATDLVNDSLKTVFTLMPRITLGSVIAYVISNFHDIWAYSFWKKKTKGKHLWLRNNASTLVSQLLDTVVFTLIAFSGVYEKETLLEIAVTTLLIKWVVALLDTPMLYLARYWVRKGRIMDTKD